MECRWYYAINDLTPSSRPCYRKRFEIDVIIIVENYLKQTILVIMRSVLFRKKLQFCRTTTGLLFLKQNAILHSFVTSFTLIKLDIYVLYQITAMRKNWNAFAFTPINIMSLPTRLLPNASDPQTPLHQNPNDLVWIKKILWRLRKSILCCLMCRHEFPAENPNANKSQII